MAAIADATLVQSSDTQQSRKKRKKSRFIKQGYHKSEKHDARRVAARAFLSGITRDSHLQRRSTGDILSGSYSPGPTSVSSRRTFILPDDAPTAPPSSKELLITPKKLYDIPLDAFQNSSPVKATAPKSWEQVDALNPLLVNRSQSCIESPISGSDRPFPWSVSHERRPSQYQSGLSRTHSIATADAPTLVIPCRDLQSYGDFLRGSRIVFTAGERIPFAVTSVLPYNKHEEKLRLEHPRERMRVRTNSMSLQLELDGIELGDSSTEVSLAFLLSPVWMAVDSPTLQPDLADVPLLVRKQSFHRHLNPEQTVETTPRPRSWFYQRLEDYPASSNLSVFPWQLQFQENHTPVYVILNYHPLALDNHEYFVGKNTTTITPLGYMVSIIEYCKASDMKKGINEQFSEVYPFINLTLTKLRRVKRDMYKAAVESEVDLAAVAYAYVYYEKLVLMGRVTKPVRKIVAGACLLLAAKFSTDMKRAEIKSLIDGITDVFHISSKELLLYEFPVLAALQFSLLTPDFQALTHLDQLRAREMEQN